MRSSGTWPAYRICSSCTVHSMSARPPRPSLRCRCGSAPLGSRSWSTRPLIRRTSITSSSLMPLLGEPQRVDQLLEAAAQVGVADHGVGAQQRLGLPHLRPLGVVGGVGVEGAHQRALLALGAQVGVDLQRRVAAGGASRRRTSLATAWRTTWPGGRRRPPRAGARTARRRRCRRTARSRRSGPSPRSPSGSARSSSERCGATARPATSRVASRVASVSRDRPAPTSATSMRPSTSPAPIRSSSRRRTPRTARTASPDVLVPARGGQHLLGHRLGGQRDQVVGQHPHALRLALEQVGDVARGGEQRARAARPPAPRRAASGGTTECGRGSR